MTSPELTKMIEDRAKELHKVSSSYQYCVGRENLTIEKTNWDKLAKHCIEQEIKARINELKNMETAIRSACETNYYERITELESQLSQLKEDGK